MNHWARAWEESASRNAPWEKPASPKTCHWIRRRQLCAGVAAASRVGVGCIADIFRFTLSLVVLQVSPHTATASEEDDYVTEVVAPGPTQTAIEEQPGFATRLDTKEAQTAVTAVEMLLETTTGVETRSLGGLGDFATVSVRGSAANQVLVLLDGVPLNSGAAAEVNVNLVTPDLLSAIDVYRSGAPVWLGAAPMGSAIDLRSRADRDFAAGLSASYGSFNTRRATGFWADRLIDDPGLSVLVGLSYFGTQGDFRFYDDLGTPYNLEDDVDTLRENNASNAGNALARLRWEPRPNLRISLIETADLDDRGVPGIGQNQSETAHNSSFRSLTQVAVEAPTFPAPALDTHARVYVDVVGQRFDDADGEVGLGHREMRGDGLAAGAQIRLSTYVGSILQIDSSVDGRYERFETRNLLAPESPPGLSDRLSASPALQATLRFLDDRVTLTAGARADWIRSQFDGDVPFSTSPVAPDASRTDVPYTVQGGARFDWSWGESELAIQGTGGGFGRLPTFLEMFGDEGSVIGNAELEPETTIGGDLGLTWQHAELGVEASLVGFGYNYDNLIQFFQNSQRVARPENVASARIAGIEAGFYWPLPCGVSARIGYGFTDGVDTSNLAGQEDNDLPARPRHSVTGGLAWAWRGLTAEYVVQFDSEHPVDRAGYQRIPDRHMHSARLSYAPDWALGFSLAVDAHNLLDQRTAEVPLLPSPPGQEQTTRRAVSDFLGFPLPGRSIFVTLAWQWSEDS